MGFATENTITHTTPGRVTHLFLDPPFPTLAEFPFSFLRIGKEIARAGFGPNNSSNVTRLGNGGIALKPIQMQAGQLAETAAGASLIMGASDFDVPTAGMLVARPRFRQQTELPGMTYNGAISSSGDNFLVKIIQAGQSWAQTLSAHQTAFGSVPISPYANVPMDRIGVGKVTYAADTGYCWRFFVTGTQADSRQMLGTFYFGGPVESGTIGRYALGVDGTGIAILFEQTGATTWEAVHSFRYAPADRVAGTTHQIIIRPYVTTDSFAAGYIDFNTHLTDAPPSRVADYFQEGVSPNVSLYVIKRQQAGGSLRENVTGTGNVWWDQPRDARHYHQFSKIGYPASGYFYDYNFCVPFYLGTHSDITISWEGSVPSGCTLTGRLFRDDTDVELTETDSDSASRTYTFPADVSHFYAKFEYTSDGNSTPVLTAYRISKDGYLNAAPDEEATEVPIVTSISVSGAESDPSHETCTIMIEDLTAELDALNFRGRVPYRLETAYDPDDDTKRSVLSAGFFIRTNGTRRGSKKRGGFGGAGAEREFPSAQWKQFAATGVGHWMRLNEKIALHLFEFSQNSVFTDVPGLFPKVTDVCRTLITYCGYEEDQIDIPDNPMRLMPREGQTSQDTFCVMPGQQIGQIVVDMLRDYLGWFLVHDPNAGDIVWRAIAPSTPPYNNLATFYTTPPTAVQPTLVNHGGAYGNPQGGYWSESGAVSTFIRRGTLTTFVKPPEANAVLVIGAGGQLANSNGNAILMQWLINRDGLNYFPDYEATKDENPDWIGELLPLLVVDFSLGTQAAVDYFCWRIFHIACHGIKMARFEAPLVLVTNENDELQSAPRPLRYYDPVLVDDDGAESQWLVRNVNPNYRRDAHQWAMYELEAPRAPYV